MKQRNRFPPGWDEARIRRVITHYEGQSDEEAVAEDEAAFKDRRRTVVEVPIELMPVIRGLIGLIAIKDKPRTAKKTMTKSAR